MKYFFVILALLISLTSNIFAGLTINPSRIEISMLPGGTANGSFTVKNDYAVPVKVAVSARDWFLLPENKDVKVEKWLKFRVQEFDLKPAEARDITFEVFLPTDTKGFVVGMVSFTPVEGMEQSITLMTSVSVYVNARGTEDINWSISDPKLEKMKDGKLQVNVKVSAAGNMYIRPQGEAKIMSGKKEVAKIIVPESRPVYPGMDRSSIGYSDTAVQLKKGKYKLLVNINGAGIEKIKKMSFTVDKTGAITEMKPVK